MRVDQCLVCHTPRAQFMQAEHARRRAQGLPDGGHLRLVETGIDQLLERPPGQHGAHAQDHEAHQRGRQQIEEGPAEQGAADADHNDQGRGGIGTGMQRIGDEQLRALPLGDADQVAIEPFLGQHGADGDPEGSHLDGRQGFDMLQAQAGLPENAAADQGQRGAEDQCRRGFDASMAVGMLPVGRLGTLPAGINHEKVGQQVGKRMQAVRKQRLRVGQPADQQLQHGHHQIDADADPGRALRFGGPLDIAGRHRRRGKVAVSHSVYLILSRPLSGNREPWEN